MSISVLVRLKNVVNVDILFTGKCKTKLSMCYSLQASADGRRLPRPGRVGVPYETYPLDLVPPGPNYIYNMYPPVQIILYRMYPGGTFYLDNKYPLHIIWTPPLNVEEIITYPLQVRMHMTLHVIYTTFSPSLIFILRGPT